VNAHRGIESGRKGKDAVRRWSMKTRAFRTGLSEGFGAPMLFFAPTSYPLTSSIDASVDGAWKAVSRALGAAYGREMRTGRGKKSGKATDAD
jgi:hypothetical protein